MLRSVTQCASQKCLHSANRRIRVLLHSFFQGWNKLNMSHRVSKYFSCVSNVSIICKPVRVFSSKWQPWKFIFLLPPVFGFVSFYVFFCRWKKKKIEGLNILSFLIPNLIDFQLEAPAISNELSSSVKCLCSVS